MEIENAKISSLEETKPRIYSDGITSSQPIFGNVNWDAENGEKIDSKAIFSSGVLSVPEGGEISVHSHEYREEIYFILSGSGVMSIKGKEIKAEPGMAFWFPAGIKHGITNSNEELLRIYFATAVTEPGHMEH